MTINDCPPECFPDDDSDRHQHCPQVVTITRFRLYNIRSAPGAAWRWTYNFTVGGDQTLHQYGPDLTSLRSMLKRRYPGTRIVENWATGQVR